jgi:uncharacterized membrane-anchored protein
MRKFILGIIIFNILTFIFCLISTFICLCNNDSYLGIIDLIMAAMNGCLAIINIYNYKQI